ncbi:dihydroneopterin triphosphate diphosphatase [Aliiglaciecola lipolytica]|uniref:Dihydroneopterin triphosphate pyrophosphatase n=1 Tax=Aliiglaciecola lipolytica E3 TaxID=1127673 RepID=K6YFB2_9ALTE|nr:dihydroneopterin triphosphate diphosphatase [Aliiglaciecola lipolytica]GAC15293.1 dihydroneopterin triphosphate pyrophosphatase [Aliiglaciecola lipolytica E3]
MTLRRPESALVVIFDTASNVLVMQRQDDPDFWQSVTGTLEQDEQPMQTAIREVAEETGINIMHGQLSLIDCRCVNQYEIRDIWQHRYPPDCKFNTEHVFALQVNGDENITLTEHLSFQWLPKSEAMALVWSDTNRAAIQQFVPEPIENACQ